MNIVFVGLASNYTPGMSYQDNELVRQTLADGHRVTYISAPTKYVNGVLEDTDPEDTVLPDGLHLIRLPYCKVGPDFVTKKFRKFKGVYELLEREKPDVIFCHNIQYWSVLDVIRYKKDHPGVKLYADTHTDYYTSGTNWLSRYVLHRIFYRYLAKKVMPHLEKYFYIIPECRNFSLREYGISPAVMEFYPLGGKVLSDEVYEKTRRNRRAELAVGEDELLLLHAGKLESTKRTADLLRAFASVPELKARLAVIGSIPEEMKPVLEPLMKADGRVIYLGWKSGEELQEYLCASDLYCQPGKVSAILQNAVCMRCPVLTYPHQAYTDGLDYGNLLWVKSEEEIREAFRSLAAEQIPLHAMKEKSKKCAEELLDYRALAARIYQ